MIQVKCHIDLEEIRNKNSIFIKTEGKKKSKKTTSRRTREVRITLLHTEKLKSKVSNLMNKISNNNLNPSL